VSDYKIIELNRMDYAKLCEMIPSEYSFSSPDYPTPNRVLWIRHAGYSPTMLIFTPKKSAFVSEEVPSARA